MLGDKYEYVNFVKHGLESTLKITLFSIVDRRVCTLCRVWHNRINSTKPPASGAEDINEPRLSSQVGRVREVVCACVCPFSAVRAVEVPVLVCLRSSCSHVTEIRGL